MNITITFDAGEEALLQQQADDNNAQPNRAVPSTPESILLEELQPVAEKFLEAMREKYASEDRKAIIAALADPAKLATLKAALAK